MLTPDFGVILQDVDHQHRMILSERVRHPGSDHLRFPLLSIQPIAGRYWKSPGRVRDVCDQIDRGASEASPEILDQLRLPPTSATTEWGETGLNDFNRLAYLRREVFDADAVPDHYVTQAFGEVLGVHLSREIDLAGVSAPRVLELSHGGRSTRWPGVVRGLSKSKQWEFVLSDFDKSILPPIETLPSSPRVAFSLTEYSIDRPFLKLHADQRYHAVVATYAFDSVHLPGDRQVALDASGHVLLGRNRIVPQTPDGPSRPFLEWEFQRSLGRDQIDPILGEELPRSLSKGGSFTYPGGMAAKIVEIFDTIVAPKGVMVLADVAYGSRDQSLSAYPQFPSARGGVHFQIHHLMLLSELLKRRGFETEIQSDSKFHGKRLGGFGAAIKKQNNHWVVTIRRSDPMRCPQKPFEP